MGLSSHWAKVGAEDCPQRLRLWAWFLFLYVRDDTERTDAYFAELRRIFDTNWPRDCQCDVCRDGTEMEP